MIGDLMLPFGHMKYRRDEPVWGALADPTRRRILDLLRERARTTSELCAEFPQSRFAVMKHLGVLEEAGLLTVRRSGRERWNAVNATPLRRIYERWLTPYQQLWASSLARLGAIAEREAPSMTDTIASPVRAARIEQCIDVAAAPATVFHALVADVHRWWFHTTYAASAPDLRIEPHVGGRFFEVCGDDERLYATVTRYEPGKRLWLSGAMSMSGCVIGTIEFTLEGRDEQPTVLHLSHRMLGDIDDEIVERYTEGWRALLDGLRAFVETGAGR